MTKRISRSAIDAASFGDFSARVARHAVEMRDWRAHMARVTEDEKNGITGIEKHMAHPRPIEHPLIDAAVNENSEMDCEIVEDGPTPEQVLRARKNALLHAVALAEQDAIARIIPPGRGRLMAMRENDILKSDADRFHKIAKDNQDRLNDWHHRQVSKSKSFLEKIRSAVGLATLEIDPAPEHVDAHADVAKTRAGEDTRHLEDQIVRRAQIDAITRIGAQAQNDIEDLTAGTIDAWSMPDFTGDI